MAWNLILIEKKGTEKMRAVKNTCMISAVLVLSAVATLSAQDEGGILDLVQRIEQAVDTGNVDDARDLIEQAREMGFSDAALARVRAGIMLKQGLKDEAQAFLLKHLESNPSDIAARALLVQACADIRDPEQKEQAVAALEEQVAIMTRQANRATFLALLSKGRLELLKGELTPARLALMKAKRMMAQPSPELLEQLLKIDFMKGDRVSARIDAEALVQVVPNHPFANFALGSLALQREDWALAVEYLERSVASKADPGPLNDLAWALLQLGRLDEAAKHVESALVISPQLTAAMDTLGTIRLKQGQLDDARAQFLKALELVPDDVGIKLHLAEVYQAQGKVDQSKPLVEAVLQQIDTLSPVQQMTLRKLGEAAGILVPEAK